MLTPVLCRLMYYVVLLIVAYVKQTKHQQSNTYVSSDLYPNTTLLCTFCVATVYFVCVVKHRRLKEKLKYIRTGNTYGEKDNKISI